MVHHEETHITIAHNTVDDVQRWRHFCASLGMKALHIELNTFERQLMSAVHTHGNSDYYAAKVAAAGFIVLRVKREIQPYQLDVSTFNDHGKFLDCPDPRDVVYYECHVKLDGPFRPAMQMSSRDLLREDRWYVTRRMPQPFNYREFVDMVRGWAALPDDWREPSEVVGYEYEAAVLDTNPELDTNWR